MIFRVTAGLVLTAVGLGACGNYSNDDLAYMNAVPAGNQLAATLPAYSAALPAANQAELAATTHNVTSQFNQMIDNTLGGVHTIRSYGPSSRTPTSRTWGPFASTKQVGWDWQLTVSHDDPQSTVFTYELEVENTADPSGGVDFIAAARSGGESSAPAVAMDAVSRNCRLDESSKRDLLERGDAFDLSARR